MSNSSGNLGQQAFQQQSNLGYGNNKYIQDGGFKDGGYGGSEIYRDDKNHLADNHHNQGYYSQIQGGRKDLGNGETFDKKSTFGQNSLKNLGEDSLNNFKKGHHKTGFKKSYHKDESGNDESFYDSDHDEGNREFGNNYGDHFNNEAINNLRGGHKENEYASHELGHDGHEGSGKLIANNHGVRDYQGRNGYYDNANNFGQLQGGQFSKFGKSGGQHGYHNGFNNGRNLEVLQGDKFGSGFSSPYGY